MGSFTTFPELLILIPLLAGAASFFFKKNNAGNFAVFATIVTLIVSIASLVYTRRDYNEVSYIWMKYLGSTYYVSLDAPGRILTFLTAVSFPLILIGTAKTTFGNRPSYFALMLLAEAGLMGVFCAKDALVFYFFWELALIPIYFLCSLWGGEKRVQATFKFFVYTFLGSLLMLIGIIYIYIHTEGRMIGDVAAPHSFSLYAFQAAALPGNAGNWVFWLSFLAFAIKMPIFPLHTWQPDAYDQSGYGPTMVLSGVMVKMGLLGAIRWLLPVLPAGSGAYGNLIMWFAIIGLIYASLVALRQDNLRKLVAYSSIAHIGLMCAALFSQVEIGYTGTLIQMFNHGINILGIWLVVYYIETKTGTKKISGLGGLASSAPSLTLFAVIIALANIALPLTNAFPGEFMMFSGIWQHSPAMAAVATIGVILAAWYTLAMLRNVFYGPAKDINATGDIDTTEKLVLAAVVAGIFIVGTYPQPLINLAKGAAQAAGI